MPRSKLTIATWSASNPGLISCAWLALRRVHPRLPERARGKAQALIVLRKELREPGRLRLEHRLHLAGADSRRRSHHDVEHPDRPIPEVEAGDAGQNRRVRRRHPHIDRPHDVEATKRRWSDADDREGAGVELNGLVQDIRAAPEAALPQAVAD